MKNTASVCPSCGLKLSSETPELGCPRCLLGAVLPESAIGENRSTIIAATDSTDEQTSKTIKPQSNRQAPSAGEYFGEYELVEELARGGMGTIYRARQTRLNRAVALKTIRNSQFADETAIERFYTEAEAAAGLDHPGIISVYEVGCHDGHHYFSMPLIENGSLGHWIHERHTGAGHNGLKPEEQTQCAAILEATSRALHFAHQRQILHRDLKPGNILLQDDNTPCITDFGLARDIESNTQLTASGTLVGTPAYMSPEQAEGDRSAMTTATDVYGLGAVMYEMLTGRPPFSGDSTIDVLQKVINADPLRPTSIAAVDQDLETICMKCLEKDPAKRYGSAEALAEELQRWLTGQPIHARSTTFVERLRKWAGRHPAVAGLSAALFAVIFIAFVVVFLQLRETQKALELARETAIAEATAHATVLAPDHILTHDGPVLTSTFSPDGTRVLTSSHDRRAIIWDPATGKKIAVLEGHAGVLSNACFSPDGSAILTVSSSGASHYTYMDPAGRQVTSWRGSEQGDRTARVWDAASGQLIAELQGHTGPVTDGCFSPDGTQILTGSTDRTARIWDASSGKELRTLEGHLAAVLSVAWSPEAGTVLTSSYGSKFEHYEQGNGDYSSSRSTVSEPFLAIVWNAGDGSQVFKLRNYRSSSRSRAVFSSNGRWIATAAEDTDNVALWDAADGSLTASLDGHVHEVNAIAFSADCATVVTASSDGTARVYSVPDGELISKLKGHDASVLDAQFSPDGKRVVTAAGNGEARVWETSTGKGLVVLKAHYERVFSARFSPDGLLVTTASLDGTAAIWKSATMDQLAVVLKGHTGDVNSIQFSADGQTALTAAQDGSAVIWDAHSGQALSTLRGHPDRDSELRDRLLKDTRVASFSPDGRLVVTAGEETKATITPFLPGPAEQLPFQPLRLFDAETGKESVRISGLECGVQTAAFSPDGRLVVAAPDAKLSLYTKTRGGMRSSSTHVQNSVVHLVDVETGEFVHALKGHRRVVYQAVFSPDGARLATADAQAVRIFNVADGELVAESAEALIPQSGFEFSPDGRTLLCSDYRPDAVVLNANDLSPVCNLKGHTSPVIDASFCPDGRWIATSASDGTARIWDGKTGEPSHVLDGHRKTVFFAEFDPTGRYLATASEDRVIRLWDVETGKELTNFSGHTDDVTTAAFSSDGRWLGTGSDDYTARLWPVHIVLTDPEQASPP